MSKLHMLDVAIEHPYDTQKRMLLDAVASHLPEAAELYACTKSTVDKGDVFMLRALRWAARNLKSCYLVSECVGLA